QALHRVEGLFGIGDGLAYGLDADQTLAAFGEGDNGGCGERTFGIDDQFGFAAFHDGDARIGGAQIDPDDLAHISLILTALGGAAFTDWTHILASRKRASHISSNRGSGHSLSGGPSDA